MKYSVLLRMVVVAIIAMSFVSCQKSDDIVSNNEFPTESFEDDLLKSAKNSSSYVHGIVVDINGEDYYLAGPPDGTNGENDVPGHSWVQFGPNKLVGKHYNTGPFGAPKWWSSDAMDGELLYKVHGIIDEWTMMKANHYAKKGFVHYHEFVKVSDGSLHPTKVIWLRHIAVTKFTLDGGPGQPNPPYEHMVKPGVDWKFPNNYMMPYEPEGHEGEH